MNYYNEIDPQAAQWLRNLIAAGHLPAGDVDERSIEDVRPDDLRGYVQCHFFAGIGGWPYALALAGWPADRPVWTGSCPCQPFSAAGKGAGFADERHLWPAWQHLIAQRRPAIVFGEQVASKAVEPWIDLVQADLEGMGYAFGCVPFPAAGIGAPHIRDRNYWVADASSGRGRQERDAVQPGQPCAAGGFGLGGLAYADHARLEGWRGVSERADQCAAGADGLAGRMANADGGNAGAERQQRGGEQRQQPQDGGAGGLADTNIVAGGQGCALNGGWNQGSHAQPRTRLGGGVLPDGQRSGPTNGQWADADWLCCTDGKWRPVEPGTFPLAHGIPGRVVRLRAYGNAIVPAQAAQFIRAWVEAIGLILPALERAA